MTKSQSVTEAILERAKAVKAYETDAQLAELLGIDTSTVSKWRQRGKIPLESRAFLAEKLGVPERWLVGGDSEGNFAPQSYRVEHKGREFAFTPIKKIRPRLSAGPGFEVEEETDGEIYSFRTDWLKSKGAASRMRLAEVEGLSMLPTLNDKDLVLFDMSRQEPRDGSIMVISKDGRLFVKRVWATRSGFVAVGDNANIIPAPEPWPIEPDGETVRIIGLVIWHCGEL